MAFKIPTGFNSTCEKQKFIRSATNPASCLDHGETFTVRFLKSDRTFRPRTALEA